MNSKLAEQARDALRRHVVEALVPRCVDREYGGFLVDFDERWQPAGPHHKTLEHASRMTYAFAVADRVLPGQGCDELVRHGCAFLQQALWDGVNGGFYAEVDRSGAPRWEGLKHPHAVTYAAQAFIVAEPYLPPGEAHSWALRSLGWLDDVAWDPVHGGYWGSYNRANERYPDGARLPTFSGRDLLGNVPGLKENNTLGDAIEMLTTGVVHGLGGRCADRLAWMIDLLVNRLVYPTGVLPYLFSRDWRPVPDLVRVGQQLQLVHRLLAVDAVGGAGSVALCRELMDFCLASARHPCGGFSLAVTGDGRTWPATSPTTDSRYWWVQFEAVRSLHALATQKGIDAAAREKYGKSRDEQWAFVSDHFFDTHFGGIRERMPEPARPSQTLWQRWFPPKQAESAPLRKTHGWKDAYHEAGTFFALSQAQV